jgi:DNA-binding NtrC family response regulator
METNAKILVADENIQTRHSTKDALLRKGFRNVDEATNGEEALIKINRNHPDIVITDIWLSKLDGIGLIRNYYLRSFREVLRVSGKLLVYFVEVLARLSAVRTGYINDVKKKSATVYVP